MAQCSVLVKKGNVWNLSSKKFKLNIANISSLIHVFEFLICFQMCGLQPEVINRLKRLNQIWLDVAQKFSVFFVAFVICHMIVWIPFLCFKLFFWTRLFFEKCFSSFYKIIVFILDEGSGFRWKFSLPR